VRNVDLNTSTSVRIVDRRFEYGVGKYLGLVASAREQDVRRMRFRDGKRRAEFVREYISEVPI